MTTGRGRGARGVAFIVALISVMWVGNVDRADGLWPWALSLIGGAAGIATAVGLWRGRSWSLRAYWAWATLAVVGFAVQDSLVEPVWWKVALPAGLLAAFLLAMGWTVKSTQALRRT